MKKLYAVLADIHGNWPALRKVVKKARKIAREEKAELHFICLGDVVDYGPQPNECVQWVNEHCLVVVRGNHERAMVSSCDLTYSGIDPEWWPITLWTCRSLKETHQKQVQEWQEKLVWQNLALFHASLAWGDDSPIEGGESAATSLARLPIGINYGLFGHTHVQGYYLDVGFEQASVHLTGSDGVEPRKWESTPLEEWIELPAWSRALLNPGSVGQPRYPKLFNGSGIRRDNRACYMLLKMNGSKGKHVQFRFERVRYNVDETVRELRKIYWPKARPTRGSDITRGGDPPPPTNPLAQQLREVRERPEMLHELVERVLIPTLLQSAPE